jgi:hypothetical protein
MGAENHAEFRAALRDPADVRGHGLDSGHHVAEEAPAALTAALVDFLRPGPAH